MQAVRTTLFHLSALVLGPLWFSLLILGWATGLGLLITLLGLPVLWLTLVAAREMTAAEARLAREAIGARVVVPPRHQGWALRERALDPWAWRGQVYLLARFGLGMGVAIVLLAVWGTAFSLLTAPLWYWSLPNGIEVGVTNIDHLWEAIVAVPIGVVAFAVALPVTKVTEVGWRRLAEWLLRPGRVPAPPGLRITLGVCAALEGLCLLLWALTGMTSPWPAWTALGLTVPAGVHASIVLGRTPLERQLGVSATAMLVCLGAWAIPGFGYPWPVWPLLGMGVALAIKALIGYGRQSQAPRIEQLTRTRAGAVDARDDELSRIERDLHDGAQARLVAVAMNLGLAEDRLDRDPEGARELVLEAQEQARSAIRELRDLARGIAPPVLTDRGLLPAVEALAVTSPFDVRVHGDPGPRPDPAIERAAYFVAAEALANASKHALPSRIDVTLGRSADTLTVEVADDGRGGANPDGAGLRGLRTRVEAIDGRLDVESGPGTIIRASLPCASS
jgi:signal transduction histidine kinase